jgi:hypothetical protein
MKRWGRCGVIRGTKDGEVVAFGNLDEEFFTVSLVREISGQLQTEEPGLRTHDTVVAGVVSRYAMKDVNADLLLGGFFGNFAQTAVDYIEKELNQFWRRAEVRTCYDTLSEGPTRIIHHSSNG